MDLSPPAPVKSKTKLTAFPSRSTFRRTPDPTPHSTLNPQLSLALNTITIVFLSGAFLSIFCLYFVISQINVFWKHSTQACVLLLELNSTSCADSPV